MANRYGTTYEFEKKQKEYQREFALNVQNDISPMTVETTSGTADGKGLTVKTVDGKSRTFKTIIHVKEYKEAMRRKEQKKAKESNKAKKTAAEKKKNFIKNGCGHKQLFSFFSSNCKPTDTTDATVETFPSFASVGDGTNGDLKGAEGVEDEMIGDVMGDEGVVRMKQFLM